MTDKSEIDEKSQLAARLFLKANDELGLIFTYQPKRHTHDTYSHYARIPHKTSMLSISSGGKGKVGGGHMDAQALKSITFVLQTFKQALLSCKNFFFPVGLDGALQLPM